jgi:hypothetical protein
MKWGVGAGEDNALRFVQTKLREALEVARTTRIKEASYFTEMAYLAISNLIREKFDDESLTTNGQEPPRHSRPRRSRHARKAA